MKHFLFKNRRSGPGVRNISPLVGIILLVATFAAVLGVVGIVEHFKNAKEAVAAASTVEAPDSDKARKLENMSDPKWSDENTLCINDELYGFDHRIETYLFIGTDNSGTEEGDGQTYHGGMADFLLLMVIDHTDGKYGYLQIDRNTVTEVPMLDDNGEIAGYPVEQICTAHWYGRDPTESAENTVETICELLGELDHIDGYYVLNMESVKTLNSSIGGVEVTFTDDLTEADPAFQKGATITLTDDQAEKLVRTRMAMSDDSNAKRMERQRIYMQGFFDKAIARVRSDMSFANTLWNTLLDAAVTNMSGNDFSRIAEALRSDESRGILRFEGKSQLGTLLPDGLEHEEFYPTKKSVLDILTELFTLQLIDEEDMYISEDFED